jgi:hypothetical protein
MKCISPSASCSGLDRRELQTRGPRRLSIEIKSGFRPQDVATHHTRDTLRYRNFAQETGVLLIVLPAVHRHTRRQHIPCRSRTAAHTRRVHVGSRAACTSRTLLLLLLLLQLLLLPLTLHRGLNIFILHLVRLELGDPRLQLLHLRRARENHLGRSHVRFVRKPRAAALVEQSPSPQHRRMQGKSWLIYLWSQLLQPPTAAAPQMVAPQSFFTLAASPLAPPGTGLPRCAPP